MCSYSLFQQFLRDNACETQFHRAFHDQSLNLGWMDRYIAEELFIIDETFINRCFNWEDTPQGREYWRIIDEKWFTLYMQLA